MDYMLPNVASMVQGLTQFVSHQKTAFVKLLRDYANLEEL